MYVCISNVSPVIFLLFYVLPIDYLLIALDALMLSHKWKCSGTKHQITRSCGPEPGGPSFLGLGPWAFAPWSRPIGNQLVIFHR